MANVSANDHTGIVLTATQLLGLALSDVRSVTPSISNSQESALLAPANVDEIVVSTQPTSRQIETAKQEVLQSACKRRKLSSSGTKSALAARLRSAGFKTMNDILLLPSEFTASGVDEEATATGRSKSPHWTMHETARLCHIISSPVHSTKLVRMHSKSQFRAELDRARHDPCSNEFADLFKVNSFTPTIPSIYDRITEDLFVKFDPCLHPYVPQGSMLKSKWNKIRSRFTVARDRFSRSGQSDADVFTDYTDGDPALCYLHCEFYNSSAMEFVVRTLPSDARVEQGIEDVDRVKSTEQGVERNRKRSSTDMLYDGLKELSKSIVTPLKIESNTEDGNLSLKGAKLQELDISDRMPGTVTKLMALESQMIAQISEAQVSGNNSFAEILTSRLETVRSKIDKALDI